MSLKRTKGRDAWKSRAQSHKIVLSSRNGKRVARRTAPKLAVKTVKAVALKVPAKPAIKVAPKVETKVAVKPAIKAAIKPAIKAATKLALQEAAALKPPPKPERIHSHPTMCLHCHLIVEMFHERGADPVKGAWLCPRCGHKYLFSHWKIKRQARSKSEAA